MIDFRRDEMWDEWALPHDPDGLIEFMWMTLAAIGLSIAIAGGTLAGIVGIARHRPRRGAR